MPPCKVITGSQCLAGTIPPMASSIPSTEAQQEQTRPDSTADYARFAAEYLSERLASDIVVINVEGICSYADFLVIATGETDRHLDAMANDLTRRIRENGLHAGHREGAGDGGWVLIDFPGFVVHLFSQDSRDYYALDRLWARGTEVVRLQ